MADSLEVGYGGRRLPHETAAAWSAVGEPRRGVCRHGVEKRGGWRWGAGGGGGGGGGGGMGIKIATSMLKQWSSPREFSLLSLAFPLLLLFLLLLGGAAHQIAAEERGCGLEEFLAAYRDPDVAYYEVNGNIALNQSLPPLSKSGKSFSLVGGGLQSTIDGVGEFGGIVLSANHSLILDGLRFYNFRSSRSGSVLSASSSGHVLITACLFRNNTVTNDKDGGALHFGGTVSYIIRSSVFIMNRASGNGGSISSSSSSSSSFSSSSSSSFFLSSSSSSNSSSFSSSSSSSSSSFEDSVGSSFSSSSSSGDGGADISGRILGCTFAMNSAGKKGGVGAFSDELRHIKLEINTFVLNRARGGGGALSFRGGVNTMVLSNQFAANLAMSSGGGAIHFLPVADVASGGPHSVFALCLNDYHADVARMKGLLWLKRNNLFVSSGGKNVSNTNITFCPTRPDFTEIHAPGINLEESCATCQVSSSSHQAPKTATWTALL